MIHIIICSVLILYYVKLLYTLNDFIYNVEGNVDSLPFGDAVFVVMSIAWLIINIFSISGPFVLFLIVLMILISHVRFKYKTRKEGRKLRFTIHLYILMIINIIIGLNALVYNYSFWKLQFIK